MKDNFSTIASTYAQFRPVYPKTLYDFLIPLLQDKKLAWDCGCGNGQVTKVLSEHFEQVVGTDISEQQIAQAPAKPNIQYQVTTAEQAPFDDHTVNLITVAQALHWFNLDAFYKEVNRVAAPGAVLAVWGYSLLHITTEVDAIIYHFYSEVLGDTYWDPERKLVMASYKTIPFPFKEIQAPELAIHTDWELSQLVGYLKSWSAVKHYIDKNGTDPVIDVEQQLRKIWPTNEVKPVSFPIFCRIGQL